MPHRTKFYGLSHFGSGGMGLPADREIFFKPTPEKEKKE